MATQFCMACGKSLPADAKFCAGCGTPTAGGAAGTGPTASAPPPAAAASSPAPAQPSPPPDVPSPASFPSPPLGAVLGLEGCRNFLLQHQLLSGERNYRVLNHEKRHLFTVKENMRQELMANVLGGGQMPEMGLHFGRVAPRPHTLAWTVEDSARNAQGTITIQIAGNQAISTLAGIDGNPVLAVNIDRGMAGGLRATAAFPDGRAMFETHGNLLRHSFLIRDPAGKEVAKIHESFVSIRDTYNLDLVGDVDPLCPLIFAILIDREKQAS